MGGVLRRSACKCVTKKKQVRNLEERLAAEEKEAIESTKEQLAIVEQLKEHVHVAELDREDMRIELEKNQAKLAEAKEDAREERSLELKNEQAAARLLMENKHLALCNAEEALSTLKMEKEELEEEQNVA